MGWTCLLLLPIGLIGMVAGDSRVWSWIFSAAILGPTVLSGVHLAATPSLTSEQKKAWRHGLFGFWNYQTGCGFFVAWEYLFSREISRADFSRTQN